MIGKFIIYYLIPVIILWLIGKPLLKDLPLKIDIQKLKVCAFIPVINLILLAGLISIGILTLLLIIMISITKKHNK